MKSSWNSTHTRQHIHDPAYCLLLGNQLPTDLRAVALLHCCDEPQARQGRRQALAVCCCAWIPRVVHWLGARSGRQRAGDDAFADGDATGNDGDFTAEAASRYIRWMAFKRCYVLEAYLRSF